MLQTDRSLGFHFRRCGTPSCICFKESGRVSCGRLGSLHRHIPSFTRMEVENMTSLDLSNNDIQELQASDLDPYIWPNLQVVDLSNNNNFDCRTIAEAPPGVKIIAECEEFLLPPEQFIPDVEGENEFQSESDVTEGVAELLSDITHEEASEERPVVPEIDEIDSVTMNKDKPELKDMFRRLQALAGDSALTLSRVVAHQTPHQAPHQTPHQTPHQGHVNAEMDDVTEENRNPKERLLSRFQAVTGDTAVSGNSDIHQPPANVGVLQSQVLQQAAGTIPDANFIQFANKPQRNKFRGTPAAIQKLNEDERKSDIISYFHNNGHKQKLYVKASGTIEGKRVKVSSNGHTQMVFNFKGVVKVAV